MEPFLVDDAVEKAIKMIKASYAAKNIEVIKEKAVETDLVLGHPNEFAQVMLNILSNAKEAILEKGIPGIILIHSEKGADVTTVFIRNNGGCIPADILPKIFDPYFTTKESGTGIGLYMSKMIEAFAKFPPKSMQAPFAIHCEWLKLSQSGRFGAILFSCY